MSRLVLLLSLTLTVACAVPWEAIDDEARPAATARLPGSLAHLVSPPGLERLAAELWADLEVRYTDGFTVEIETRVMGEAGSTLVVYGPGTASVLPQQLSLSVGDSGDVAVALSLAEIAVGLDVRVTGSSGEEISCHASLRFEGPRYAFDVAGEDESATLVSSSGTFAYELVFTEFGGCDFAFESSHEQQVLTVVRDALGAALEDEREAIFAPEIIAVLRPRFGFAGRLPSFPEPDEIGLLVPAVSELLLTIDAAEVLRGLGPGLGHRFDVGLDGSASAWDDSSFPAVADEPALVLPASSLNPDAPGETWDEAVVVSRSLLERAVQAVEHVGLLSEPIVVEHEALVELWPEHRSLFLQRLTGERTTLRFRARTEAGVAPDIVVSRPPDEAADDGAVRIRIDPLIVEVYGSLGEVEPLLTELQLAGLEVDLRPAVDEDGWLHLEVSAVRLDELSLTDGVVTIAEPSAALVSLLFQYFVPYREFVVMETGFSASPQLIWSGWTDDGSYAMLFAQAE